MGLQKIQNKFILLAIAFLFMGMAVVPTSKVAAQACTTTTNPATTYGQVTQTVNVATAGTYKVWSRIKASNANNNSYYFQVGNGCAINVGDSQSISTTSWSWVNYQNGNSTSAITVNLTAGTHTLKFTGKEADVQLDRVLLLTSNCSPTGTGDDCATADTINPTASISSPASGTTVTAGSSVNITASASDNASIAKVEFYVNGSLKGSDSSTPYTYSWNTAGVASGTYSLTARAYDTSGNTGTSSPVSVTVSGNTSSGVTLPFRMNTGGPAYTDDTGLSWTADTYNVGGSVVDRGRTVQIASTTNDTLYQYERWGHTAYDIPIANGTYRYKLHFAETSPPCSSIGCRVQNIAVENTRFLTNFDIFKEVGQYKALVKEGTATVSDGKLTISFSRITNAPAINGIEILPSSDGDTVKPTVSLTAPVNGSSITIGNTVNVTATANDNTGVTKVEFYRGSTLMGSDSTAPYSYSWNTSGLSPGSQTLTAKAYDAAGNNATSSNVSVTLASQQTVMPGDANNDGRVNGIDYSILAANDGKNHPPSDFNKDGVVGAVDLAILLSRWTW